MILTFESHYMAPSDRNNFGFLNFTRVSSGQLNKTTLLAINVEYNSLLSPCLFNYITFLEVYNILCIRTIWMYK